MRLGILVGSFLMLTACAPAAESPHSVSASGQTSFHNSAGAAYTTTDARLGKELAKLPDPINATKEQKKLLALRASFETFKLLRFNKATGKDPQRLGRDSFSFDIQRKDGIGNRFAIHFEGVLNSAGNNFSFSSVSDKNRPEYVLDGKFTDADDGASSAGTFTLHYKKEMVDIQYSAYQAQMEELHVDSAAYAGLAPDLKAAIDEFKKTSNYWWVSKMFVAGGVSITRNDILQLIDLGKTDDIKATGFSFTTQSVETGEADVPPAEIENKSALKIKSAVLEGNAKDDSQVYTLTFENAEGKSADVMVDIDRKASSPNDLIPPNEKSDSWSKVPVPNKSTPPPRPRAQVPPVTEQGATRSPWPADPAQPVEQAQPQHQAPSAPETQTPNSPWPTDPNEKVAPQKQGAPQQQTAPQQHTAPQRQESAPAIAQPEAVAGYRGVKSGGFIVPNMSLPRTKRMIEAYEKNWNVDVVQEAYDLWKNPNSRVYDGRHLAGFFKHGQAYRDVCQMTAQAYDAAPIQCYLLAVESNAYFSPTHSAPAGDRSKKTGEMLAIGPFQIHPDTASDLGMSPSERPYFVSSSCAAAKYLEEITDKLQNGDVTLAILGYNQGPTVADRVSRLGRFSYTYAKIAHTNLVIHAAIIYTAKVLATYFIAAEYRSLGFEANGGAPRSEKMVPPGGMRDQVCTGAARKLGF
jgi:hypothetical protein